MRGAVFLAFAYLRHTRLRSAILVLALAMIVFVPLATRQVLSVAQTQLTARAADTPLMIGARGSALDLMMNGLYFSDDRPEPVTMAQVDRVWDSDLAIAIPLYIRYSAGGWPVVGTTLDYFDFRELRIDRGRSLAQLGEAVLGARAAAQLGLGPGDVLISDPENLFDLAGSYPLEMQVVGVLAPTQTADDDAVFVDVQTAWVIEGLGHGHDDVVTGGPTNTGTAETLSANAAQVQFTRITPQNLDSFHFHGAPGDYPISSVIVLPWDARASAILRGRYLAPDEPVRVVVPEVVVTGLLQTIFRIGRILDGIFIVIGTAALVAVALTIYLSVQLRGPEISTATRIGCHPLAIGRMLAAELVIVAVAALALAAFVLAVALPHLDTFAIWLITA